MSCPALSFAQVLDLTVEQWAVFGSALRSGALKNLKLLNIGESNDIIMVL
jgi:hypothetical protein